MSDFDKYFTKSERYYHPKLNLWKSYLNQDGISSEIEIHRERDGLIFSPTIMFMHFYEGSKEILCDKEPWDSDLNQWCVREGVRAKDPDNEVLRFSLALRTAFKKPGSRFGDGFFNGVLLRVIDNGPFKQHKSVSDVRNQIHRDNPTFNSQAFADCSEMIDILIQERALELLESLHYNKDQAIDILAGALGEYLDQRFSVTGSRLLGFPGTNRRPLASL
ncbi:hypothetical protein QUF72_04630 [Desulfobacterales bacterium HSG2]|nr:hypothetical protein [Desulfobacterales bacterium HSG2]